MFSVFFFGIILIFSDMKKIFLVLFCIEILSFSLLMFFSYNVKFMFLFCLLCIILSGLILVLLALQYIWMFNKNFLFSYLK